MRLSKLTKPELEEIYKNANFTEEEEEIYHFLCRGKTIKEISQKTHVCDRTVNRRIAAINKKIERLEGGNHGKDYT